MWHLGSKNSQTPAPDRGQFEDSNDAISKTGRRDTCGLYAFLQIYNSKYDEMSAVMSSRANYLGRLSLSTTSQGDGG